METNEIGEATRNFYRRQGDERTHKAITEWLLANNIIRENMFGDGYVAFCTDGETVLDFKTVGASND